VAFEVEVPEKLGDKDLVRFFRGWSWEAYRFGELVLNLEGSQFLAPWALTLFCQYALEIANANGVTVRLKLDPSTEAGRYAVRAGLFELFGSARPDEFSSIDSSRLVPLARIHKSSEIPAFANGVISLLEIGDEELEDAVKYAIVELLRNVVQHSHSRTGGLALAQYFPSTGIVEMAVADCGIGVRAALSPGYPTLPSDLSALRLALLPHVSGTFANSAYSTMRDNAGLGLFFIKEIATRAGGGFFIGSGNGLVDLWGNLDGSPGRKYFEARTNGWPGTFAYVQFRRDHIADFNSLLGVCRALAAEARKDPSELNLDFIDEVPEIEGLRVIHVGRFEEDTDEAARVREQQIIPSLSGGELVVLDFSGIRAATQSFVHALMYRILRESPQARHALSIANSTSATAEAIRAVAAYANTPSA